MRFLGVVPARGGSRGVARKNVKLLCGKPLLAYTAESALASKHLSRVVLSTDDAEIAEVGTKYGLDVPFMRPAELAKDDTPTLPVIQHVVSRLADAGDIYDAIVLLQPTDPLRSSALIDTCIERLVDSRAHSVISVHRVPHHFNPHWVYFSEPGGQLRLSTGEAQPIPRRQALPPAFHRSGSVYVVQTSVLMKENSLFGTLVVGVETDPELAVNIDTPADWERAERVVAAVLASTSD